MILKEILRKKYFAGLVIAIAGITIFSFSIKISFFGDEIAFIKRNRVTSVTEAFNLFNKKDYDGEYYRPIVNFTSGIITSIFEYNAPLYRIFNLILHTVNAILLYFLALMVLRNSDKKEIIALMSGLFFVVFPLHDLAVIWHTDLTDRLMFTFFTTSLIFFIKEFKPTFLSLLFFMLSLLSKEMAFSLPLIIWSSSVLLNNDKVKDGFIKSLPYFLISLIIVLTRIIIFNNNIFSETTLHSGYGLVSILRNYVMFIGLLLFPFFNYTIQTFVKNNILLITIPAIVFAGIIISYLYKNYKADKIFIFLIIFIIITILPASRLLMKWYLYLPSAGFTIAINYLLFNASAQLRIRSAAACLILITYSLSLVVTQSNWISVTSRADQILTDFVDENYDFIKSKNDVIILTIPGKVNNYPVLQLNFEEHLRHYLGMNKKIEVLSRSSVTNFNDEISMTKSDSFIFLIQTKDNYFTLFGYEKNIKFIDSDFENGLLKRIRIEKVFNPNDAVFYFTNGKFKRAMQ